MFPLSLELGPESSKPSEAANGIMENVFIYVAMGAVKIWGGLGVRLGMRRSKQSVEVRAVNKVGGSSQSQPP